MEERGSRTGWPSSSTVAWVNRQASLTSRVWARPSSAFPGPALGFRGHHGDPGAVDGDVEHVRGRRGRREGDHLAGADRVGLGARSPRWPRCRRLRRTARRAWRSGRCRPARRAGAAALANGTAAAARAVILARPGDIDALPGAEFGVPGSQAMTAGGAVIPGPAHRDRAEHGVDGLVPVGRRTAPGGPAPQSTRGPRWPASSGQQVLQQPGRPAWSSRCGSPAPPPPGRRRRPASRAAGRPAALPRRPPPPRAPRRAPLFPGRPGRGLPSDAGVTGRASQIASLTSTICSVSAANSW